MRPKGKWLFNKDEITPVFQKLRDEILAGTWSGLDVDLLAALKPSRVVISHGTDSRVLEYILVTNGQVFDKKYFKMVVQLTCPPETGVA